MQPAPTPLDFCLRPIGTHSKEAVSTCGQKGKQLSSSSSALSDRLDAKRLPPQLECLVRLALLRYIYIYIYIYI